MNDIFNDNVPLKKETPAFEKHVLPAVPSSEVYLEDCVTALKRYADNHFDLAIVDPPYGNIDAIGLIDNKKSPNNHTSAAPAVLPAEQSHTHAPWASEGLGPSPASPAPADSCTTWPGAGADAGTGALA